MDGGASTAAIEVLVQNMIDVFKEEYSLLRGLDEDAQQLQRTLGMIQAYLSDAEKKSITQDAVKFWLRQLEVVAFDADNALDELNYHLLHKKVYKMKTRKDKVLSCFSSFNRISRRRNMAYTIKRINTTFESMNKSATDLGLQSIILNAPAAAATYTSSETDSFSLDPIFVGRDDDVPKLVEMLNQTHPQERMFSILALVGMGGMGKTTLTRKVFNHGRVKAQFGSLLWVHVSQTFDPIILFNKILFKLTKKTSDGVESRDDIPEKLQQALKARGESRDDIPEKLQEALKARVESRDDILEKLKEALKAKTYLLVLDDVWNQDVSKWEDFINSMSGVTSTKGNGIIITTRNTEVATKVKPFHIHHLNGLSDDDCWSIIKAKTFDRNGEVPYGLETIGKEIAKRCQGLPLAANVVGGVLCCRSEQDWGSVNEKWVSDGEGGENISKILKLSFDHLSSPSLKKCFAYCSVFPKGWEIWKEELIELWMAEGFLQPSRRNDMESVGSMFFNVLLQNSLLQVAYKDEYGNVWSCVMHNLVHDVASSVLSNNADRSNPVRYMFLKEESSPIPKEEAKHLRTLFLRGGTSGTMFLDFKSLHNLTLSGDDYKELPNSIRKLIHLRNLNISETRIKNLPEWIGELHQLETLRAETPELKELPSTLKYLINLRHLCIMWNTELPAEIGRLTSLQTLPYFTVGDKKGYQIEELGCLKNLKGILTILNLGEVRDKEEALKANIFEKSNLSTLLFIWDEDREGETTNDESVLEGLQPHANLKALRIGGFKGKRFPSWTEKMAVQDGPQGSWVPLDNLIDVFLFDCSEIEEIPTLEHLPNLKSLALYGLKKVRFINSSFNHLTILQIEELEGLECLPDWLFYNNHNLSYLKISGCPVLRELPDGLDTLNSLEELIIGDCPNLKSIGNPNGEAGQYHGNLRELSIEGCGGLMELPRQMLESWAPTIEILKLEGLRSLKNLPTLIDCLAKSSRLKALKVFGVPNFMGTGSVESWGLGSLEGLNIDVSVEWSKENSGAINDTVDGILQGCCNSLTQLYLTGMENWEWVPQSIQHLTALRSLQLENIGVEELPQWLGNLSSLTSLSLNRCNKLRRLPSVDASKSLTILEIKDCPELRIESEWRNHHRHLEIKVDGLSV